MNIEILRKTLTWGQSEHLWARDYWDKAQSVFWIHTEIPLASDIHDWKTKLSETDRYVIGSILKTFTQSEIHIGEYWSSKVARWFPKPEIQNMALCFGNFETIHIRAYAALNEALNLEHEFAGFLDVSEFSEKIDRLVDPENVNLDHPTPEDIAKSLAIFSAFNEGVNLFSSFAALDSFRTRGLMKGMNRIIEWSIRDEQLHSEAGCKLFNILVDELPTMRAKIEPDILFAAELTVKIEENCIDQIFAHGDLPNLTASALKNYMRHRTNEQLKVIGYDPMFECDNKQLEEMQDFNSLTTGLKHTDFFVSRPSDYKKWEVTEEDLWKTRQ